MLAPEQFLDNLAGAVLDGEAVDWVAAESSAGEAARPVVRHLRLVASVARAQREILPSEGGRSGPLLDSGTPAPEQWEHLRLLERIGRGGFGEVFRAWDTRLDREVALKLLPAPSSANPATSSVIREGRLLAKVRHPNVVTIYGAEQIGNRVGLWMEFVQGRTLEQVLRQGAAFRAAEVADIGLEVCRALSAVHAAGLLHRDVKAHNVMRADDGRVVLMDFGAGRERDDSSQSDLAGTPLYLAPEVLAGGPATVQSDIYGLGVLLYHLLTGSYPVKGRTVRDIRLEFEGGRRIDVRTARPDVRPALARAIERAIDPRPERRYESADAFARDLAALRRHPGIVRLRYGLAAAAVLLLALVAMDVRARLAGNQPGPFTWLASAIAGGGSAVEHPRILVLPIRNRSGPDQDGLVDSFTAGLIRQFGNVDGLSVVPQTTSFVLRNPPLYLALRKLPDVNYVVESDARLQDGTLQIHASLVRVEDEMRLSDETIERPIGSEGDIVGVVEDLARAMANKLRLKLGPTQRRYDFVDLETLRIYLKARELRDGRGERAREAIRLFEQVLQRTNWEFAPALAALAATYGYLGLYYPTADMSSGGPPDSDAHTIPPRKAVELMSPYLERALEIDPLLAEAHAAEGMRHALALDLAGAERSFGHAIDLEPTLMTLYGDFVLSTLLPWERLDDAMTVMKEALESDPSSLDLQRILARVQLKARLYDDSLNTCRRVLGQDPTFPVTTRVNCTWALFFSGKQDEALDEFQKMAVGPPRFPGIHGYIHALKGEHAEAERIAAEFADFPLRQAEIYALMGDADRTIEALEQVAVLNPLKVADRLTQPELDVLRDHPWVDEFRRKHGIAVPVAGAGPPDTLERTLVQRLLKLFF